MTESARPQLRVRRLQPEAPVVDHDDRAPQIVGALALALPGLDDAPSYLPLRLVPPASPPLRPGPCPPLRPLMDRLAQALAEVLAGGRPPSQLAGHATYDVICQLERWSGRFTARHGSTPGASRAISAARPRVTSLHVGHPAVGVAEVCVAIDTGSRHRAIALRMEAPGDRWRCTALQLG